MVYPEGMPQDFAYYEGVFGIAGMGQNAQDYATVYKKPYLMYDEPGFQISELFYAGLQKASFGILDFKGARAASVLKSLNYSGKMKVFSHSQGTLIANRMMVVGAFPKGSQINMNGPAANYFTSAITAGAGGYKLRYNQVHADWIGVVNFPNINVLKNVSGFGGIFAPSRHGTKYQF